MSRHLVIGSDNCVLLCRRTFECSVAEYWRIRGPGPYRGSAVEKFVVQRRCAQDRGVSWVLTLPEWWSVWQHSGKWAERGRKRGQYVMARYGDIGPYALGNVFICTNSENSRAGVTKANKKRLEKLTQSPLARVA